MPGRTVVILSLCFLMITAASAPAQDGGNGEPDLRTQLAELRQALARTRLELQQAAAELEDIKAFLADRNLDETLAEWRAERAALVAERRAWQAERRQLERARDALHQVTLIQAREAAERERAERQAAEDAVKPKWSAQYEMGLIDRDQQTLYVESTDGSVLVQQYPSVDRRNVMVRGTFLNESHAPWRYTFEIRLAGDEGRNLPDSAQPIVGQWRYQTPRLGPGDLHAFEVKVPVTNVHDIEVLQIGNVTWDRPTGTTTDGNTPTPRGTSQE